MRHVFHWFRAQSLEILVLIALPFWRLFALFRKESSPEGLHLDLRPILLVHGYLNAGFVWDLFKRRLRKHGVGPIYTVDLGAPFQSILDHAGTIEKKALKIREETKRRDLVLIGHSMGGLASAYYATKMAPPGTVSQVIVIASPLQGTKVAKIGLGRCCREMEIGSSFLEDLSFAMTHSDIRFYHIGTKTDLLVIPYTSSLFMSHQGRSLLIENLGHASLLLSPRIVDKVSDWLKSEV
jgi:triacylglycerol esterase/lipase EstA (alpha/beta hydrolase family)